jgi:hypothetical protein
LVPYARTVLVDSVIIHVDTVIVIESSVVEE